MKNSLMILFLVLLSSQSSFAGEICHQDLHNCLYYLRENDNIKQKTKEALIDDKGKVLSYGAAQTQLDGVYANLVSILKMNNDYYLYSYISSASRSHEQTLLPIKKDKYGLYVDRVIGFSENIDDPEFYGIWEGSEGYIKKTRLSHFKWNDFFDGRYRINLKSYTMAINLPSSHNKFIINTSTGDRKIRKYWTLAVERDGFPLLPFYLSCISNCPKPVNKSRFVTFSGSMNNISDNSIDVEMVIDSNDYSPNKIQYINTGDLTNLTKISTIKKGACYKAIQNKKENGYLCGTANDSIFSGSWYDLKWKKKYTFKLYREII